MNKLTGKARIKKMNTPWVTRIPFNTNKAVKNRRENKIRTRFLKRFLDLTYSFSITTNDNNVNKEKSKQKRKRKEGISLLIKGIKLEFIVKPLNVKSNISNEEKSRK